MKNSLKNKTVVITGASSGIGLELTKLLHKEGCQIVAAALSIETLDILPNSVHLKDCDVSYEDSLNDLFDYAIDTFGPIDIFIANAGFTYYELIKNANWDHITKIFNTNVTSVIYSAEKMKEMYKHRPYQFMCTGSSMSFLNMPGYALYSSTKAALDSFYRSYKYELTPNQCFQIVYPISTKTRFFEISNASHIPWPSQSASTVAKAMLIGLKKKHKQIFPSKSFKFMLLVNNYLPCIFPIYNYFENYYFKKWLETKNQNNS